MSSQLKNKVALVTGAASGIGRAVVERYLAEGARVVAFDRREVQFGESPNLVSYAGDVRSLVDNQRAVQLALERFGGLDVLVANAGIYDNRRPFRDFSLTQLDAAFDELYAVNVKGYMLAARAATEALAASHGCIIFTSSISGTNAGFGGALYVSAKHAINGLTKQLALELAPHIRVNAVAPGFAPTGLRGLESLGQEAGNGGPPAQSQPLQVIATPEDYAWAYVFLASNATAHTATGSILALDGGTAIRGPRPPSANN